MKILLLLTISTMLAACKHGSLTSSLTSSSSSSECSFPFSGGKNYLDGANSPDTRGASLLRAYKELGEPSVSKAISANDFCIQIISDGEHSQDVSRIATYLNRAQSPRTQTFTSSDIDRLLYAKGSIKTIPLSLPQPYSAVLPAQNDVNVKVVASALDSGRTFWFTDRFKNWSYKIRLFKSAGNYVDIYPVYGVADRSIIRDGLMNATLSSGSMKVGEIRAFFVNSSGKVRAISLDAPSTQTETSIREMF